MHGLNSDRAGRSPELPSVLCSRGSGLFHPSLDSQEGYPGSVRESEICEDNSLIIFFTGRDKLFAHKGK